MPKYSDDETIREVVARRFLSPYQHKLVIFLGVDDEKDPSESLLKRLSNLKVDLRKWSRGKENPDGSIRARPRIDRETGDFGGILTMGSVNHMKDGTVELEAHLALGRLHGEGGTLVLKKVRGAWKVVKLKDWGMAWRLDEGRCPAVFQQGRPIRADIFGARVKRMTPQARDEATASVCSAPPDTNSDAGA